MEKKTENYSAFEKWYNLMNWLLDRVEKFPKNSRFTVASRISNLSLDILEGVIEALYSKMKINILRKVNLNLEKIRIFLRLSFERKYFSQKQYSYAVREVNEFGKVIGGWMKWCEG